jgi:hypothetical protein
MQNWGSRVADAESDLAAAVRGCTPRLCETWSVEGDDAADLDESSAAPATTADAGAAAAAETLVTVQSARDAAASQPNGFYYKLFVAACAVTGSSTHELDTAATFFVRLFSPFLPGHDDYQQRLALVTQLCAQAAASCSDPVVKACLLNIGADVDTQALIAASHLLCSFIMADEGCKVYFEGFTVFFSRVRQGGALHTVRAGRYYGDGDNNGSTSTSYNAPALRRTDFSVLGAATGRPCGLGYESVFDRGSTAVQPGLCRAVPGAMPC